DVDHMSERCPVVGRIDRARLHGYVDAHQSVERFGQGRACREVFPEGSAELRRKGRLTGTDAVQQLEEGQVGATDGTFDVQPRAIAVGAILTQALSDFSQRETAGRVTMEYSRGRQVTQHAIP